MHPYLLGNHSLWWASLHKALSNLIPVGREASSVTLGETLHHGTLGVIIRVLVDGSEELVKGLVSIGLILILGCLLFERIPVLGLLR